MDIVPYIMEAYESVFGEKFPGALLETMDIGNLDNWDPYADGQYDMGFPPSDTSDTALKAEFKAGYGGYIDQDNLLYESIRRFLLGYSTGKHRIYRGVGISTHDWDELIRRTSGKQNQIDESTIWSLLSNKRKKFNSYTAFLDIAKMYARGAINDENGNGEHVVGIVFSAEVEPENINFPMSMALNAKDMGRGFEIVVTDEKELSNFRIEMSNIDSMTRDTIKGYRNVYPIGNGKFLGTTYDAEDNCYYINLLKACPSLDRRRMSVPTGDCIRVGGPFSDVRVIGDGLYLAYGLEYNGTVIVKGEHGNVRTILSDDDNIYRIRANRDYPTGIKEVYDLSHGICNVIVTAGPESGRILFDRWFNKIEYDEDSDKWFGIDKDGSETELETDYTVEQANSTIKFSWDPDVN